ncbi:MAG: glycoside hydrolase N-terminal domain-containing protein [Clostridia bacterium]|nr:glycoside hydrolase N-terminal domain-containing protein [Clostridia bacterium]
MKKILSIFLSGLIVFSQLGSMVIAVETEGSSKEMSYRIWFDESAQIDSYDEWEKKSLPVGNGNIGGNVFGGYAKERITLNEKTLWKGGPGESRPDYNGGNNIDKGKYGETLKEVQRLFMEGKSSEASSLCNQLIGDKNGYGGYQQFGNLYMDFGNVQNVENYSRGLDIINGIADVKYDHNGAHYEREIFSSYIDNVMVVRLTSEGKDMDFALSFQPQDGGDAPRTSEIKAKDNSILLEGSLNDNGLRYSGYLEVVTDGQAAVEDTSLRISNTDEAVIILSMGTDYAMDYPVYRTGESQAELTERVKSFVEKALKKDYETLRREHVEDVSSLMNRVTLDLGQVESDKTTDALLAGYKANTLTRGEKSYLEVLLYQYGRYLLIGSSRETDILPANLQGMWVGKNGSAWNSDYHINVNLQMNYWHAYNTNLKECAIPMINYVEGMREPGRLTADIYFGVKSTPENPENGFTANTQSTPYGWTAPGWSFDWGWSPAAVPWMLQNVWEYYEYTLDEEFLRETIYPMMKEEAKFYSQILIEDENGKLISTPAYSPEHGPRTNGNTYEQSLIWQLFTDVIKAGEVVGESEELLNEWRDILARLRQPIEIGDSGQIKEWYEETTLGSVPKSDAYGHRHLSHLLGLYPGDLISIDTPEWFEAARVSLDARVDASTGWAMGQRINAWARLGDGEHMYYLVETLMKTGILDNLWDTHPPFQIDGNFGYTAGVTEALMQSNMGYINILPAICSAWKDGEVEGLIARGNYEVGIKWQNKVAKEVTVKANNDGECTLQMTIGDDFEIKNSNGETVEYNLVQKNRVSFDADKGEEYTITNGGVMTPPDNIKAVRKSNKRVIVTWNKTENAKTYNVYRIGEGQELIGENVAECTFTDYSANSDGDTVYSYRVSSVSKKGIESELSEAIVEEGGAAEKIDSNDKRVAYTGSWKLYSESDHYESTNNCSWTAGSAAELKFSGTGIALYSVAKPNYNGVYVYIDGEKQGDYYSVKSNPKQKDFLVFSKRDLPYGEHTIKVEVMDKVVTGVKDASISVDYFKVYNDFPVGGQITITEKGENFVKGITEFDEAGRYIMITAVYEGMELVEVKTQEADIPQGRGEFEVKINIKGREVKVFLWDKNMECFTQMQ